eukprot:CAMPEP_0175250622 /NCGR_PEP_ID=MMETSP0093-20121207/35248_1 /TAXON_ID=311494 /ORGANISM="Alexandrium monilatum, Strain CCMP3105" /LENGTH=36 /DNA_ID= /DNA_START= /DNA_END= /DNA_ORIENTATION=
MPTIGSASAAVGGPLIAPPSSPALQPMASLVFGQTN